MTPRLIWIRLFVCPGTLMMGMKENSLFLGRQLYQSRGGKIGPGVATGQSGKCLGQRRSPGPLRIQRTPFVLCPVLEPGRAELLRTPFLTGKSQVSAAESQKNQIGGLLCTTRCLARCWRVLQVGKTFRSGHDLQSWSSGLWLRPPAHSRPAMRQAAWAKLMATGRSSVPPARAPAGWL